ncbi:MAG: outer-membrane lipoprotein carrier protein LolA, partial [Nitrospirota bacterium]
QGFDEKVFKGKLYLKKPKLARWDYTKPVKHNIVINGDRIILYFHEQKQAIIQKASAHPDAEPAMGILSNIEKWQESFTIKSEDTTGDFFRVELTPKSMTMVKKVVVEIGKKTSHIERLTLFEKSGNKVSFSFSGIKFNNGIKDSLFDFKIPSGVEVLEY